MSRPSTPSKPAQPGSTRSHREDVLQFLDNLDSFDDVKAGSGSQSPTTAKATATKAGDNNSVKSTTGAGGASAAAAGTAATTGEDAQSVLDFLDEIVTSRERRVPPPASSSSSSAAAPGSGIKRPTASSSSPGTSGITRSSSRTALNSNTAARKSTESTRGSSYLTPSTSISSPAAPPSQAAQTAEKLQEAPAPSTSTRDEPTPSQSGGGGWGWGSVWSQASSALQQARTVAEEQVSKVNLPKNLPTSISSLQAQLPTSVSPSTTTAQVQAQASSAASAASEQARQWRSGMLNLLSTHVDIEKLRRDITETGLKAMNDIINAVAPPIAEHEVIQVNLSHDMLGYEGVETLVYRALAKVMEQVEGGDLVVNRGNVEDQPVSKTGTTDDGGEERDLNTVEGFLEAYKLAEANLEALIKRNYKKPSPAAQNEKDATVEEDEKVSSGSGHGRKESSSSFTSPVTICPVFMRIQPVIAPLPFSLPSTSTTTPSTPLVEGTSSTPSEDRYLYFILLLRDPTNELVHKTLTQSMPSKWLDIPFEDNEWVEDIMVDVIRRGVEILGEEYVKGRMYGRSLKNAPATTATTETLFDGDGDYEKEGAQEEKNEVERIAEAGVLA